MNWKTAVLVFAIVFSIASAEKIPQSPARDQLEKAMPPGTKVFSQINPDTRQLELLYTSPKGLLVQRIVFAYQDEDKSKCRIYDANNHLEWSEVCTYNKTGGEQMRFTPEGALIDRTYFVYDKSNAPVVARVFDHTGTEIPVEQAIVTIPPTK